MKGARSGGRRRRGGKCRIRRTSAAVRGHEQGTPSRPIVTMDADAREVGRVFVVSAVMVRVPLLENQLPLLVSESHNDKCAARQCRRERETTS